MKIQPAQNYPRQMINPQFKAVYPVVHWVAESNGSYAPVLSEDLTRKLQRILVKMLNKGMKTEAASGDKYAADYLAKCDLDYRRNPFVRSYYDRKGGWEDRFVPISYLISGTDAADFDNLYGKAVGKAKSEAPVIGGVRRSAELNIANRDYALLGRRWIMDKNRRIYDSNGVEYALHTKFQTIRNKYGKVKGYEFVDLKFCPEEGPENPFVRLGLIKPEDSLT